MVKPKRGRPEFKATPTLQRKVEQLVACGMSEDDTARAIGCSTETLRKHFGEHLRTGRAKRRAEVIALLFKAARGGNVSAQKKLEDMTGMAVDPASEPVAEKAEKLGKKEQAQIAAEQPPEDGKSRWSGLLN